MMKPVQEVLAEYPSEPRERKRVELLQRNADNYFPWLDNLDDPDRLQALNSRLADRGHPELKMRHPAAMPPLEFVPNPSDQKHIGLFGAAFVMTEYDQTSNGHLPVTSALLLAQMRETIQIPMLARRYKDHRGRPSFYRALCIDPGLMINLATNISSGERPLAIYGPEIFVAYRIMSRLVDRHDPAASNGDGTNNRGYMFRRSVSSFKR